MNTLAQPIEQKELKTVLFASLWIALAAQICIPLPFTPVPITFQNFAVLLIGATLGPRIGTLAVLAYLMEGLCGLPVFAHMGSGPLHFLGPRGGYLLGFVVQAFVAGTLVERKWKGMPLFWAAWSAQMMMGLLWLTPFVGREMVFALGLLPFIPGAILKSALFSYLYRKNVMAE